MISLEERIARIIERQEDMLGNVERSYTATLRVSPDGTGADGLSWRTAYLNLPAALDAASTDANDLTLIRLAPGTYDINQPGQPTWTANVIIQGSHRCFTTITNTHATASCVLRLENQAVVQDVMFVHIASDNGLILTEDGVEVLRCHFDGTALTGAGVSLMMAGDTGHKHAKVINCDFEGNTDYTIALKVDTYAYSNFERIRIHNCERGIWIQGSTVADYNLFNLLDIGHCALALDIDQGNEQVFSDVLFHHNTRNVDDEVKDHHWLRILGAFPIYILPDNFTGISVACGAAGVYGGDTQVIAANAIDNPFTIVGVNFGPDAVPAEWYHVRFSADSGATWYDVLVFSGDKREGIAALPGTEFIHNADTRISCSARSVSGGNNVDVWVEVQEI